MGGLTSEDYENEPGYKVDLHLRFETMDIDVDNTLQERAQRNAKR